MGLLTLIEKILHYIIPLPIPLPLKLAVVCYVVYLFWCVWWILQSEEKRKNVTQWLRYNKRFCLLSLSPLPVLLLLVTLAMVIPTVDTAKPPKLPDNLLVVIADFVPVPEENKKAKGYSESIAFDLWTELEHIKERDSEVPLEDPKLLGEVIRNEEKAKEKGREKEAHLVVWGYIEYREGKFYLKPIITVVRPLGPNKIELEERQPKGMGMSLAEPEVIKLTEREIEITIKKVIEETADVISFIHSLAFFKQQKYEDAIKIFKEIKNPNVEVFFYHGTALFYLSRFEEAVDQFKKALDIDQGYAQAYNNRGSAYYSKGDYDRAIADYNKALEIDPEFATPYSNRGAVYGKKGDYDLAIGDCNKAIEIDPEYASAYSNRGAVYGKKGDYDLAIGDCNKAIEINPGLAVVYNNRAFAYYYKKEYNKALEDVHKAQGLGYQVDPEFLDDLRKASGRDK